MFWLVLDELLLPHMKRVDGMITDNRKRLLHKLHIGQVLKVSVPLKLHIIGVLGVLNSRRYCCIVKCYTSLQLQKTKDRRRKPLMFLTLTPKDKFKTKTLDLF